MWHSYFSSFLNHVGSRHCQKPLGQGLNLFATVELSKTRTFDHKPLQNVFITIEFAQTTAFDYKSCQKMSTVANV